jgi:TolA-binding protein
MYISGFTWAASCERCYEKIDDDKQFCTECELSTSNRLTNMKSREEQITSAITSARENYKNKLEKLIQYYMDIGNHSRLKKARKELKSLNKIPQLEYMMAGTETTDISPSKNIEEANILFQDGVAYKNPLNIIKRKTKLISAAARFKKIIENYPESDKADDAAYELAEIYEGYYFKDYEGAASYYVKCYNLNGNTDNPARFKAARIYDNQLEDYVEAARHYKMALDTCKETHYLEIAKTRLEQLKKEGY